MERSRGGLHVVHDRPGLHGQGQSALLRAIFGANPVTSGSVTIGGERYDAKSPRDAIRRGCAYVSGDRGRDGVISGRPIIENVTPIHYLRDRLMIARPSRLRNKAMPALEAMHTKLASLFHPINSLSGGNQQKVVIAKWLLTGPRLILLNDPTRGIDVGTKQELYQLLRDLADAGAAILFYTTDYDELIGCCDRVLIVYDGAVSRVLEGDEITETNIIASSLKLGTRQEAARRA